MTKFPFVGVPPSCGTKQYLRYVGTRILNEYFVVLNNKKLLFLHILI